MKVPSKFPEGTKFWASFSGDEFVELPDGKVFRASDSGELEPRTRLPFSGCAPISEAVFRGARRSAADLKAAS